MSKPVFERKFAGPTTSAARLHPPLVRAVAEALQRIFSDNEYADKVVESTLRGNPKAGSTDRAFIAESIYDVVRYYRLYTKVLGRKPEKHVDFWQLAGVHFVVKGVELPDWQEFKNLKSTELRERHAQMIEQRPLRESIPDWLDALGEKELGDQWEATLHQLNQPASVVLRANRLRTDRRQLWALLRDEGILSEDVGTTSDALKLTERRNVFRTAAFKKGLFEVQDYSSQLVAPLLAPEPGMRVVDACAGGGGKSLHLSALMGNKGSLIALDTLAWKLDELRQRARRAGATNIETRPIENRKVIKRLYGTADRLLLDVPCSGLGVLRRNPDSKWKLSPETIENLRVTQQDILQSYSPIVKVGGRMVYATCSILPSENQQQVEQFLASAAGKGWTLLEQKSILPQDQGFDGFFMALLERGV